MKKLIIIGVAFSATILNVACTTNVSFDIDDTGYARELIFPKITEYAKNNAITTSSDVLKKVTPGANKRDLLHLLGAPHFREANAAREWDYVFKVSSNSLCQYKIIFDKNMRAQSFIWENTECEKILGQ